MNNILNRVGYDNQTSPQNENDEYCFSFNGSSFEPFILFTVPGARVNWIYEEQSITPVLSGVNNDGKSMEHLHQQGESLCYISQPGFIIVQYGETIKEKNYIVVGDPRSCIGLKEVMSAYSIPRTLVSLPKECIIHLSLEPPYTLDPAYVTVNIGSTVRFVVDRSTKSKRVCNTFGAVISDSLSCCSFDSVASLLSIDRDYSIIMKYVGFIFYYTLHGWKGIIQVIDPSQRGKKKKIIPIVGHETEQRLKRYLELQKLQEDDNEEMIHDHFKEEEKGRNRIKEILSKEKSEEQDEIDRIVQSIEGGEKEKKKKRKKKKTVFKPSELSIWLNQRYSEKKACNVIVI